MIDFDSARDSMVEHQLAARGIERARVLDAMRYVPRHAFVPEGQRHWAYSDAPLPIGEHQTSSQPYRNPTLARSDIERALGDSERRFAHDFRQ